MSSVRFSSGYKSRLLWRLLLLVFFLAISLSKYILRECFETSIFVSAIVGLITSFWSLNKGWLEHDQALKDLFREFNKRFDELNESLNEVINGEADSRTRDKTIQDYLNLCSEEYLWYKKGRIDEDVWSAWRKGIEDYLKEPIIRKYFESQKSYDESYYGFLKYIFKRT